MSEPAAWLEAWVDLPTAWAELAADALARAPASTAAVEALEHLDLAERELTRRELDGLERGSGHSRVRTWLPADADGAAWRAACQAALDAALAAAGARVAAPIALRRVEPAPVRPWRAFRAGRVCVAPPDASLATRADDVVIRLAPGGAFGTGRHPTTRHCLRALSRLPLAGARVLDLGCGTGLLGVAAALLGARSVTLLDLDPDATACARALVAAHELDARCRVETRAVGDHAPPRADLTLANLESPVLCAHAAWIAATLAPGGRLVASGIRASEQAAVDDALTHAGLRVDASRGTPRWRVLLATRR